MHEQILGRLCRDRVTDFEGVAIGFVYYLTGCHQVLIVPKVKEDGSHKDACWFDVQRIDVAAQADPIDLGPDAWTRPNWSRANAGVPVELTPGCDMAPPTKR